jgi:ABC-type glycerol-3-phosphate transport system permease component
MATSIEQSVDGGATQRRHSLYKFGAIDVINYALLTVLALVMLYPLWHVVMSTFMDSAEYFSKTFKLFPARPTLKNLIFMYVETPTLSYVWNTLIITIIGTGIGLFLTALMAWGLSRQFPGVKVLVFVVVATMFLYPGLIPQYVTYKTLGIINTRAVLILIYLMQPFYLIVMRSNFIIFPEELVDAAKVDGYSQFSIFFSIVLPLSKALLAAIALFIAVQYWNMYLPSVFFITDSRKKVIQDYLARILQSEQLAVDASQSVNKPPTEVLKMASITTGILPILLVYPFLQKHFVKGALLGAVKG